MDLFIGLSSNDNRFFSQIFCLGEIESYFALDRQVEDNFQEAECLTVLLLNRPANPIIRPGYGSGGYHPLFCIARIRTSRK